MSDHAVHKAADLPPDERLLVERWLGRVLSGDETISVNVYRQHGAPTGDERGALRREIVTQAHEIGARAPDVSDDEINALLDEAFADTRRRHE